MDDTPTGQRRTVFPSLDVAPSGHRSGPTCVSLDGEREPVEPAPGPAAEAGPGLPGLPERYRLLGLLGRGGMGEVWRVRDAAFGRTVALKVVRAELLRSARALQRFREEAQVTGQLQHPGIVPVHDLGLLGDGRLWFTMKEVRGRTLGELLQQVHHAWRTGRPAAPGGFTFRRLLDAFLRVCETVGYAHARGVVHRDLKPDNVMVGDHGEVLVLDWGLARLVEGDGDGDERICVPQDHTRTRMGAVSGTPAYMPPEQARGQQHRVGPWSDVYALGATLYDVLSERPPYPYPTVERVLDAVIAAEPVLPPSRWAEGHPVDEELDRIALAALSARPEQRYPDATAMAKDVADWLDGATKRERAQAVVAQARGKAQSVAALERRAGLLHGAASQQLAALPEGATDERKAEVWDLEDEARAAGRQVDAARAEVVQLLRSALSHAPDLAEAHALLADEYHRQHVALEGEGRRREATAVEGLLRAHDRGRYGAYLRGDGALTLRTDTPAEVIAYRYEQARRRLHPVEVGSLGITPLREVPLAMGSWLLVLRAPGRVPVRYPVSIGRGESWDGVRPGDRDATPVPLPREGELGPDDCYVPAGWTWSGATHEVLTDPLPRTRRWVDGFVARRFPVTHAEYVAFLDDLVARGREEEALRWVPRAAAAGAGEPGAAMYGRRPDGGFALPTDAQGYTWRPRWPVFRMPFAGAVAYASWRGAGWRLPMELEWEKAARGVDERLYPWGDAFDPTWARCGATPGARGAADVDEHPIDEGPYGLRGLAGNVSEFVADPRPSPSPPPGVVLVRPAVPAAQHYYRGGSYAAAGFFCRLDLRRWHAGSGADQLGFRIVRSFP